jgi:hypothetical protein
MARDESPVGEGLIVSLTVLPESLDAQAKGMLFQCDRGGTIIQCGVAAIALRDLIDFHRTKGTEEEAFKGTEEEAFRKLLPEIERLLNAKCEAGRFEKTGWLLIWPVDLLRYGFLRRKKAA